MTWIAVMARAAVSPFASAVVDQLKRQLSESSAATDDRLADFAVNSARPGHVSSALDEAGMRRYEYSDSRVHSQR